MNNIEEWTQNNYLILQDQENKNLSNETDDINNNEKNEHTVAYVSDTSVSIEGSHLRQSVRASGPLDRLKPTLMVQSYKHLLVHKVKNIDGSIILEH